jgi:CheY-like chemotaxis protein
MAAPSTSVSPLRGRMTEANGRRVLVVDDEEAIRDILSFALEQEGYQVVTAANGVEALEALGHGLPGLILLDMKMPVMDGWDFMREFRARHGHEVPVVVLTAAPDARKRAEEIDAAGWLGKPFDVDVLVQMVDQHFQTTQNRSRA